MIVAAETLTKEIVSCLDEQKTEILDFLKTLVSIESPSSNIPSQKSIQELIVRELTDLDFSCQQVRGINTGGHIFAKPRNYHKNSPRQLLIGHSDTVWPVNTLREMKFEVLHDGRVTGPGIYDMKAGLTEIVYALKVINKLKLICPVTPIVFINSDEEIGSPESRKYIRWLSRMCERAYILEPPLGLTGKLKTERKGVGRFTLEINGKAAHAGLDPTKGASAILELSHQIQKLFEMNDIEKGISVNVGLIEGGVSPNVIAASSKAVIDVRIPTAEDAELISEKIHALKPSSGELEIKIHGGISCMPMEFTERNRKLWEMAKNEGKKLGLNLKYGFAGGGSDGNTTSLYTATLDGLGTPGDGAHAIHEFIYFDKLIERTALLSLLIIADPI